MAHDPQDISNNIANVIINGDYKKVISLLQSKDFDGSLQEIYGQVQHKLISETGNKEKENISLNSLKIYTNAEYYINLVQHLKCWTTVELVALKNLKLTSVGWQKHCPSFLFCKGRVGSKKIRDMPTIPFEEFADFTNIAHSPDLCNYNPKIEETYKEKILYIDLYKGKHGGDNIKLGTWSIPLENIKYCSDHNLETEFEWEGVTTEFLEDYAKIRLSLKHADHKFCESKKPEAVNGIRKVVDWIYKFRKATGDDSLSTNIMISNDDKLSLLHAAVFLEDVDLVNRILSLGADPLLESEIGSPLGLAKSLKQKNKSEAARKVYNALHMAADSHHLSNQDFENDKFTKNEKQLPLIHAQNSQEQIVLDSAIKRNQSECKKEEQRLSSEQSSSRKRCKRYFGDGPSSLTNLG